MKYLVIHFKCTCTTVVWLFEDIVGESVPDMKFVPLKIFMNFFYFKKIVSHLNVLSLYKGGFLLNMRSETLKICSESERKVH